jgi:U3 small nucleolar RNA-associated protein 25
MPTRHVKTKDTFAASRLEVPTESPNDILEQENVEESTPYQLSSDEGESDNHSSPQNSYNALLQSFGQVYQQDEPRRKRRRLDAGMKRSRKSQFSSGEAGSVGGEDKVHWSEEKSPSDDEAVISANEESEVEDNMDGAGQGDDEDSGNPFEWHFAAPDEHCLTSWIKSILDEGWATKRQAFAAMGQCLSNNPVVAIGESSPSEPYHKNSKDLPLKKRLIGPFVRENPQLSDIQQAVASPILRYQDLLFGARTVDNAAELRSIACVHALNHIFKTRDRVLKNNARIAKEMEDGLTEYRDQGFTRPKVLMLMPTRQSCARMMKSMVKFAEPEQQENIKRFNDGYVQSEEKYDDNKPADFRELFEGNDDDMFRIGIKFTRKTMKYFAQFYNADLILASPLGLRRAIETGDKNNKKGDHDFLSSIELIIVDQADALLMQNWDHIIYIFQHLNLQPQEAHGCDFSRVRPWYLDGHAKYLRQTLIFSAFITPEINALFNNHMHNVFGKLKHAPDYSGAILSITKTGLHTKQVFARYSSPTITSDPDTRFKFFTTSVLPSLMRHPTPPDGARGILLFIPSYFDFVRVRNYFATSSATQNISFGAISENGTPQDRECPGDTRCCCTVGVRITSLGTN